MTADQGKLIQISDIQTLMKDSHFACMCKLLGGVGVFADRCPRLVGALTNDERSWIIQITYCFLLAI